ncbi:hypothetical protein HYFRA_00000451 [Hymenoscyphus fraxineus]|uniref:CHRD domain-containing protein n=1 Tax=Hymenoscyphus fraxineus TaxID=746836 RepID=A0A9N9L1I7_9HELO|nr:hypothetical protein HYFRA_00000451 [Hymenoscyphus fraxineus]
MMGYKKMSCSSFSSLFFQTQSSASSYDRNLILHFYKIYFFKMQTSFFAVVAAFLATTSALPFEWNGVNYEIPKNTWKSSKYDSPAEGWENMTLGAPHGGWSSVKLGAPHGGWSSVKYPAPTGGWSSIIYPNTEKQNFTSYHHVVALGSSVKNGTYPLPGPDDAVGYYSFAVNSGENKICYKITLQNTPGNYTTPPPSSPYYHNRTSTHLSYAPHNSTGPIMLSFPNPMSNSTNPYDPAHRTSEGCMTGPFNGTKGERFNVTRFEENPGKYYVDVKTEGYPWDDVGWEGVGWSVDECEGDLWWGGG